MNRNNDEFVTISADEHFQTFGDGLWQLYKDGRMVDITINCHERSMKAHRVVLAVFSSILRASMETAESYPGEEPLQTLNLDEVAEQGGDVEYILEFIYRGEASVPSNRLKGVLRTAEMLEIPSLVDAICARMHDDDDNGEHVSEATESTADSPKKVDTTSEPLTVNGHPDNKDAGPNEANDHYDEGMQVDEAADDADVSQCPAVEEEAGTEDGGELSIKRRLRDKNCKFLRSTTAAAAGASSMGRDRMERFRCSYCEKTFSTIRGYDAHIVGHTDTTQQRQKCPMCTFWTTQSWTLLKHMAVVHRLDSDGNRLSELIACDCCDFTCISQDQLKQHVQRKHGSGLTTAAAAVAVLQVKTAVKCAPSDDLDKPGNVEQRDDRPYECGTCGFRVQYHSKLVRHEMSHLGMKPFKCDICGLDYTDRGKFKNHMQRHYNSEKLFVCRACGYACHRKDNLLRHERKIHSGGAQGAAAPAGNRVVPPKAKSSKHDLPFVCHICGRAIRRRDNFKIHLKNIHGVSLEEAEQNGEVLREEPLSCVVCHQVCTRKENLLRHMREVHGGGGRDDDDDDDKQRLVNGVNGDRPFACHVCDYSCRRKDNLRIHIWRVHGAQQDRRGKKSPAKKKVKPNVAFECLVCGNTIRRKDNFRVHLRTLHGISLEEMLAMAAEGILPEKKSSPAIAAKGENFTNSASA